MTEIPWYKHLWGNEFSIRCYLCKHWTFIRLSKEDLERALKDMDEHPEDVKNE